MGHYDGVRDANQHLMMLEQKYGTGVSHGRREQLHGWRAERELARNRQTDPHKGWDKTLLSRGVAIAAWFGSIAQVLARSHQQSR